MCVCGVFFQLVLVCCNLHAQGSSLVFTDICSFYHNLFFFLLSFIPLPFIVQGLSFKMHSNLPKSIEVLLVCIIDMNDWTIETKAMLLYIIL